MTILKVINPDKGGLYCTSCEVYFNLTWDRNAWTSKIDFCPFCGEDVEKIVEDD